MQIKELQQEVIVRNLDVAFPNEKLKFNILTTKPIYDVVNGCGCLRFNFAKEKRILNVTWKMLKKFPFQVSTDDLQCIQHFSIAHTDNTFTNVKLVVKLLDPDKW